MSRVSVLSICLVMVFSWGLPGCGESSPRRSPRPPRAVSATQEPGRPQPAIALPQSDQRLCTSVVLLIDTSGSMDQRVGDGKGGEKPKFLIARDVLDGIVSYTDNWAKQHPDRSLEFGILSFSSSVRTVLPPAKFDRSKAEEGLKAIPRPGGGTAIGRALEQGFKALFQTGCVRKYVVCVTDGENTSGTDPAWVARQLYKQTGGEVEIHFVAFDTVGRHFDFLKLVNGFVVEAADGQQLQKRLSEIYEKRILAEAMSAEQP